MSTDEFLSSRFRELRKGEIWSVHEYDDNGADYGLTLKKLGDDTYQLDSFTDSGYTGPWGLAVLTASQVYILAECLKPTI